jgi:hypothetical protein
MRGKILFLSPSKWGFIKPDLHADGRDASNLPNIYFHIRGCVDLAPEHIQPGLLVEYAESLRHGRPNAVNVRRYVPAANPEYAYEPTPEPVVKPKPALPTLADSAPTAVRNLSTEGARTTRQPSAKVKAILAAESGDRLRSTQRELPLTDSNGGE